MFSITDRIVTKGKFETVLINIKKTTDFKLFPFSRIMTKLVYKLYKCTFGSKEHKMCCDNIITGNLRTTISQP